MTTNINNLTRRYDDVTRENTAAQRVEDSDDAVIRIGELTAALRNLVGALPKRILHEYSADSLHVLNAVNAARAALEGK